MAIKLIKKQLSNHINQENTKKFELYVSPFINLLNNITNSTRPKKVGQLSILFNEFLEDLKEKNKSELKLKDWKQYYLNSKNVLKHFADSTQLSGDQARKLAAQNIYNLFQKLQTQVFPKITLDLIQEWVDDLIFQKTFNGLMLERPVATYVTKYLLHLRDDVPKNYKFKENCLFKADEEMEAKGIDYYYQDQKINLNFQIKTGDKAAGTNVRKRQKNISRLPENVYCCFLEPIENSNEFNLTIFYNDKEITDLKNQSKSKNKISL